MDKENIKSLKNKTKNTKKNFITLGDYLKQSPDFMKNYGNKLKHYDRQPKNIRDNKHS